MNETIKKNIRDYVQQAVCNSLYSDRKATFKWIMQRFEANHKTLSIEHLIDMSADYSSLLPTNPYTIDTRRIYGDLGLKEVMTYTQFIFELPRIWYTTLYRLLCEWYEEFNGSTETAY